MSSVLPAKIRDARNEFSVATSESSLVKLQIVLKTGANVAAQFKTPMVHFELTAADAGRGPSCIWHDLFQLRN